MPYYIVNTAKTKITFFYTKRTFNKPCGEVESAIVSQLRNWQGDICPNADSSCEERGLPSTCSECDSMPCGQRCLYSVCIK